MSDLELLGIKQNKITQLNNKGIESIKDLLYWTPRRYNDFRFPKLVSETQDGDVCSIIITVDKCTKNCGTTGTTVISIKGRDNVGANFYVTLFNQHYLIDQIYVGREMVFCGKISHREYEGRKMVQMLNPISFSCDIKSQLVITPVYRKVKGMSESFLADCMSKALRFYDNDDYLEEHLTTKFGLVDQKTAITKMHKPETQEDIKEAQDRFLFDDLFYFNFALKSKSNGNNINTKYAMKKYPTVNQYMKDLPYQMTEGQRLSLRNMATNARDGIRINSLVQGDVGTGKTLVAKMMMLTAFDSNYQSVLMAPTSVLAQQHYEDLKSSFERYGVNIAFLCSDTKKSERKKLLKEIKAGNIHMVVGTHSCISKDVEYKDLALTVVDEEHRFGVKQREALNLKAEEGVHSISMSATPIPRSLAMCVYGDEINVETIKTMPKGRKSIVTKAINSDDKIRAGMLSEIKAGHQVYIVCPLVEESTSERIQGVKSVEEVYKEESKFFAQYGIKTELISGKMKQADINSVLERFSKNEIQILVSTTIIEVGVNVPNSTVICIKSAERFGLAQLHQLRGRVGRGDAQGYCILQSDKEDDKKVAIMCKTTDGFEIAREDILLRGMGDFIGTTQTGDNKYVMLMMANEELNKKIKEEVRNIYQNHYQYERYKKYYDEIEGEAS